MAAATLLAALAIGAQTPLPTGLQAITVKTAAPAILSFRPRGTTGVELRGTERMPAAAIVLKVESRPGFVEIDINRGDIKGLEPAARFGRDFLTYVLWVVSADGAAINVGEITFAEGQPISINVTTPYQTFWLMVTAEPDFAVKDPSPVVVLVSQSQDKTDTGNKAQPVPGELIYYTNYTHYDSRLAEQPPAAGSPELQQARKAVELASKSGILARPIPQSGTGEEPLPDELRTRETLRLAEKFLADGEAAAQKDSTSQESIQYARTAAQIAENARALALGAVGGIYVRQLGRELDKRRAENAAWQRELTSGRDRLAQIEAALDRERRHSKELESELLALRERIAVLEKAQEDRLRESARLREERDKICDELRRQLASLGQLTEQGGRLVLTLASDILFDFDRYDLRPAARENLARLAVVRLLLFPEAEVRYEGHTDLVGDEDYNQWLSEQRALAVYLYFLQDHLVQPHDESERARLEEQLNLVEPLLRMNYNVARRLAGQRQEWLVQLGGVVVGKGMREPVVPEKGPNDQNRRVTLIFPEARVGATTALCAPASSPR